MPTQSCESMYINTVWIFAIDISLCGEKYIFWCRYMIYAGDDMWKSHKGTQWMLQCFPGRAKRPIEWQKIYYKDLLYTIINNFGMIQMDVWLPGWIWIKVIIRLWIWRCLLTTGLCVYTPKCALYKTVIDMNKWYYITYFHFKNISSTSVSPQ